MNLYMLILHCQDVIRNRYKNNVTCIIIKYSLVLSWIRMFKNPWIDIKFQHLFDYVGGSCLNGEKNLIEVQVYFHCLLAKKRFYVFVHLNITVACLLVDIQSYIKVKQICIKFLICVYMPHIVSSVLFA